MQAQAGEPEAGLAAGVRPRLPGSAAALLAHACLTPRRPQRKPEEGEARHAGSPPPPPGSAVPAARPARTKWPPGPQKRLEPGEESRENGRRSDDVMRWCGRQEQPGTGRVRACEPPSGPCSLRGPPHGLLGPNVPKRPLRRSPGSPPDTPSPVSYTHLTLPTTGSLCRSRWSPYH